MKRLLACIAAAVITVSAAAQLSKIPQRLEIVEIDVNEGAVQLEVFKMPVEEGNHYYLSVGTVGIGDEVFQLNIDPVSELFVYLGSTLDEAVASLEEMKAMYKGEVGAIIWKEGSLAVAYPREEKLEPVRIVMRKPILAKVLEFSVDRGKYLSAAYVIKSDFNSLVSGVKIYKKIHPKEK